MNRKSLLPNTAYGGAFGTYWGSFAVYCGFCSVFMLGNGFSNSEIGIMVALSSLVSALIQPVIANLADRSRKVTLLSLIQILAVVIIAFGLATFFLTGRSITMFLAYLMMYSIHASLQPLLNSVPMNLERRGILVDYGICRGLGSLGYSIMSLVLAALVLKAGIRSLPIAGIVNVLIMILCLQYLSSSYNKATPAVAAASPEAGDEEAAPKGQGRPEITMKEFIRRHKLFLFLCLGIPLLYYHHQIMNFFMLQVFTNVGGNSTDMGVFGSIMTVIELPPLLFFTPLTRRFSTTTMLRVGIISFVIRSILLFVAWNRIMVYLVLVAHMTSFPLFLPAMVRYIDEIMDEKEAVRGQSLFIIMVTISAVIACSTGGVLMDVCSVKVMLIVSLVTCIIGGLIVMPLIEPSRKEAKQN